MHLELAPQTLLKRYLIVTRLVLIQAACLCLQAWRPSMSRAPPWVWEGFQRASFRQPSSSCLFAAHHLIFIQSAACPRQSPSPTPQRLLTVSALEVSEMGMMFSVIFSVSVSEAATQSHQQHTRLASYKCPPPCLSSLSSQLPSSISSISLFCLPFLYVIPICDSYM